MAKYVIKTKYKECLPFDEWITKLEMRAFGWVYKGVDITYLDSYDVTIDWDTKTATASRRRNVDNTFKRIEPYSFNIVFATLEFMMTIQSWIRRKLIALLFGLVLIGTVLGIIQQQYAIVGAAAGILAFIYAPSLIYVILGFATRKIFGIDKKLLNRLERNGYAREQDI